MAGLKLRNNFLVILSSVAVLCCVCLFVLSGCDYVGYDTDSVDITSSDIVAYMEELYPDYDFTIADTDYEYRNNSIYQGEDLSLYVYLRTEPSLNSLVTAYYITGLGFGHFGNDLEEVLNTPDKSKIAELLGTTEFIYNSDNEYITKEEIYLSDITEAYYNYGINRLYAGVSDAVYEQFKSDDCLQFRDDIYYDVSNSGLSAQEILDCCAESDTLRTYHFSDTEVSHFGLSYEGKYYEYTYDTTRNNNITALVDSFTLAITPANANVSYSVYPEGHKGLSYSYIANHTPESFITEGSEGIILSKSPIPSDTTNIVSSEEYLYTEAGLLSYMREQYAWQTLEPVYYSNSNNTAILVCTSNMGIYYECTYSGDVPIITTLLEHEYNDKYGGYISD